MRYWDSSAILPLLLEEESSSGARKIYLEDTRQVVWCLSQVEAASALSRRVREGLNLDAQQTAKSQLQFLAERWEEVASLERVRTRALRLLGTHSLRAADALQLGAALVFCDERTESLPFVCLDERLADAARKERFPVFP